MGLVSSEKLVKATLIAGMFIAFLSLIFILLYAVGILPFYFSIIGCCTLAISSVGVILALVYAKRHRVKGTDQKTQEPVDPGFSVLTGSKSSPNIIEYIGKQPQKEQGAPIDNPVPKNPIVKPLPSGDAIKGVWYSTDKTIKAIFYADKKFDIIMPAQPGQAGTYISGTYRKDGPGHYRVLPEFEGTTKLTSRPIESPEMEFVMEGNWLRNVKDENVQFFRE